MARVVAWCILAVALFGAYKAANAWKNPWGASVVSSPVLHALPVAPPGCGAGCKYD